MARASKLQQAFPAKVEPMLATLASEPFNKAGWLYEVKWDGYRILAHIHEGKVTLRSRSLLNYTANYKPIASALDSLKHNAVIDGEIVVLDDKGNPSFDRLQNYDPSKDRIIYYVFDLIWLDGKDLTTLPLTKRKEQLLKLCKELPNELIQFSDSFDDGVSLFDQVKKLGLEGIVAKQKESLYLPGKRTRDWLKIPTAIRQEFVVGGWTESDSARSFRSLLFGYYDKGKLYYQGHAGGGFREKEIPRLFEKLKKIETKKKPFVNEVDTDRKVHWVKPELVVDVRYATKTKNGKIRKPAIFMGLRPDKKANEIHAEPPSFDTKRVDVNEVQKRVTSPADSNWSILDKQPVTSKGEFNINGASVLLTNVEKELWKGITKANLIQYYHEISGFILPYLKDRPLSLHIKHYGPMKQGFYIKDMEGRQPPYADIFTIDRKHKKEGKRDIIDYVVCNNEATLLYLVNLGCIDLNPWSSRTASPFQADFISIDLDPSDDDFSKAIQAALATKEVLDKNTLKGIPKTSGKSGIHIYIPCLGFNFQEARTIAENLCSMVCELRPDITTTNVSINQRGSKLFVDPSQNDFADTLAAPYSVRPNYMPTVSTPLSWKEVNEDLEPHSFTINTIANRIKKKGDLFKDLLSSSLKKSNSVRLKKFLG